MDIEINIEDIRNLNCIQSQIKRLVEQLESWRSECDFDYKIIQKDGDYGLEINSCNDTRRWLLSDLSINQKLDRVLGFYVELGYFPAERNPEIRLHDTREEAEGTR